MSDVRAITVKQPWAWAIARGGKMIENRSQGTKYRGPLLVHAGKAWSDRGAADGRVRAAWPGREAAPLARSVCVVGADRALHPVFHSGAVIAVAQLVDSHPDAGCCRPWGESSYTEAGGRERTAVHHLVLEDVVALPEPVPCRGALGLWRPSADVVLQCGGVIVGSTR